MIFNNQNPHDVSPAQAVSRDAAGKHRGISERGIDSLRFEAVNETRLKGSVGRSNQMEES
jgi:hypothetical protein